jgi:phosphonate transport system substrate-binding protein
MQASQPRLSLRRILLVILPVVILGLGAYLWSQTLEPAAQTELSNNVFARILSANAAVGGSKMNYADADKDLVADAPEDAAKCIEPDVLVFSSVAAESESAPEEAWQAVLAAIKEKTGKEVKYVHFTTANEQLAALKKGELHIAVLNTGVVPAAVEQDGFVPLCTFGRDDGTYGITMKLIVPADSPIKDASDVKGRKVTFTRPDSNSGCKALVMYLRDEEGYLPDRDYAWGFSTSHEKSITGVAAGETEAAPIASDVLQRMIDAGEVDGEKIRAVYESERFPPATIGYVYNLQPEIRTGIRGALLGLSVAGTGLEGQFGDANSTKLVEIDYKNDWANARRIDQLVAQARTQR